MFVGHLHNLTDSINYTLLLLRAIIIIIIIIIESANLYLELFRNDTFPLF